MGSSIKASEKLIIAFVGMPGAGKSEATSYLHEKGVPFVHFGDLTDEGLKDHGLERNPENERIIREKFRQELGMAAYGIKAKPKIETLLKDNDLVVLDGLYSWEEYLYLKKSFPSLVLIHIFAQPQKRYERLSARPIRPFTTDEARARDIAELEKLNKGGPIGIADYLIENNADIHQLRQKIDQLLTRLQQ